MTFLTVFSAPKPFTNPHIAAIQRNAIQSWIHLGEDVQVLLVGEEPGLVETAQEFQTPLLKHVARNSSGTPLVSSIFSLARQASQSPYLAYVNADILLLPDFLQATRQIAAILKTQSLRQHRHIQQTLQADLPFLIIGQRWDLEVTRSMEFANGWEQRLSEELRQHGQLHPPAGSDYFIYPRPAFSEMPDFAIGRAGWDNWMIYYAHQQGWPLIDATTAVKIIHQNHDYSHLPDGKPHYDLEESQHNMSMAGGLANMFTVLDAIYQFTNGELRPVPLTTLRLLRSLERQLIPKSGGLQGLQGGLARRLRRLRRKLERSQ